jgi:hypothetical protein
VFAAVDVLAQALLVMDYLKSRGFRSSLLAFEKDAADMLSIAHRSAEVRPCCVR